MLNKTAAALRRNRYEVSVFETHEEAVAYLAGLFHGCTIGFVGYEKFEYPEDLGMQIGPMLSPTPGPH